MQKIKSIILWSLTTVIVVGLIVFLSFCIDHIHHYDRSTSIEDTGFTPITDNGFIDIYIDKDTNVMYVKGAQGTLTVMENADGTPKIYNKER